MKRTRLLCLLLAMLLVLMGVIPAVSAEVEVERLERLAAEAVERESEAHAGETGEVTAVEIAELDAPKAGVPFDTVAAITARLDGGEAATWQTPVIWTDRKGSPVDTPKAGNTYMPFITFFTPEGYTLSDAELYRTANLTLPGFFADATAKNGTLYFLEAPSSGLVFITGEITVPAARAAVRTASHESEPDDEPDGPTPEPTPVPTLEPEYLVHTNEETVESYGPDYVRDLIVTVKNVVEPRAVNLLIESFPAYGEAVKNKGLSSGIGFFTEKKENTIGSVQASPMYYKKTGGFAGKALRVVVNADFFARFDYNSGKYVFNEYKRSDLEFTLVHEMLHATMFDYTPNGMMGLDMNGMRVSENRFPTWFIEGTASAVDNTYSYRRTSFIDLCSNEDKVNYTPEQVIENYGKLAERFDINGGASDPGYAYTSGYLASVYLMHLASESVQGGAHTASRGAYRSGDMRQGFNYILEQLNKGRSLDDIIREIAPKDASGNPIYGSTADFQAKFLKAGDRDNSAAFCAGYLKYLESLGRDGKNSWGCILIEFDDLRETLFENTTPADPLAYEIQDTADRVPSDVANQDEPDTGGAILPGETETGDDLAVAAKIEQTDGEDDAAEDAPDGDAPFWEDYPVVQDERIAEDESIIEDQPIVVDEPIVEDQPIVVDEPIVEDEPVIEDYPIVEDEPVVEDEPIVEDQPIVEDEPVVEDEPIVEDEPVVEDYPIMEEYPVVEDIPIEEEEPGDADEPAAEEFPEPGIRADEPAHHSHSSDSTKKDEKPKQEHVVEFSMTFDH